MDEISEAQNSITLSPRHKNNKFLMEVVVLLTRFCYYNQNRITYDSGSWKNNSRQRDTSCENMNNAIIFFFILKIMCYCLNYTSHNKSSLNMILYSIWYVICLRISLYFAEKRYNINEENCQHLTHNQWNILSANLWLGMLLCIHLTIVTLSCVLILLDIRSNFAFHVSSNRERWASTDIFSIRCWYLELRIEFKSISSYTYHHL